MAPLLSLSYDTSGKVLGPFQSVLYPPWGTGKRWGSVGVGGLRRALRKAGM